MSLIDTIKQSLKAIWNFIKRIFEKILNFFKNIAGFFKQPERIKKIQEKPKVLAISIKENLDNGNFNVINCLYDENAREIIDYENHALIIETESLDAQTISSFGIKDMIILK